MSKHLKLKENKQEYIHYILLQCIYTMNTVISDSNYNKHIHKLIEKTYNIDETQVEKLK